MRQGGEADSDLAFGAQGQYISKIRIREKKPESQDQVHNGQALTLHVTLTLKSRVVVQRAYNGN